MSENRSSQLREAARVRDLPRSGIRMVFDEADRLRRQGFDIKNLQIGVPNFDTPNHIKAAAKRALDDGFVKYTANAGVLELREAIANRVHLDSGVMYDPASEIIVTVGANEAIALCMFALLDPGDEVLIPEPAWIHAQMCVRLAGAVPVVVPLRASDGYQIDPDVVRRLITNRTRMLVVNSPHNPTGTIIEPTIQAELAQVAEESNLIVVADEIYNRLTYDDTEVQSFAAFPGMRERTFLVNGFSKTYAMTGWRMGWITGPKELMGALLKVHQYTVTSTTSFAQIGAIAALEGPQEPVQEMVQQLDRRRQRVLEAVERIDGVSAVRPTGAFYVYLDIDDLGVDEQVFCQWLLHQFQIAVVPGSAFGTNQHNAIRISYGSALQEVEMAMIRFEQACEVMRAGGGPA